MKQTGHLKSPLFCFLQKKVKTAQADIAVKEAKVNKYKQQAAIADEDISTAEARLSELKADRSGAEAKLDQMKDSVQDEVCEPNWQVCLFLVE